jgi:hypothetical protein
VGLDTKVVSLPSIHFGIKAEKSRLKSVVLEKIEGEQTFFVPLFY